MAGKQTIKVKSPQMRSSAERLFADIKQIETQWKRFQEIVESSKGYWEGDASSRHQKHLNSVKGDVNDTLKRMKKYPEKILMAAGFWENVEASIAAKSSGLPKNIL